MRLAVFPVTISATIEKNGAEKFLSVFYSNNRVFGWAQLYTADIFI